MKGENSTESKTVNYSKNHEVGVYNAKTKDVKAKECAVHNFDPSEGGPPLHSGCGALSAAAKRQWKSKTELTAGNQQSICLMVAPSS